MELIFHPYVVTGYLTSVVTIVVGIFVYAKDRRSPVHRAFFFYSLTIWQWSFFTALQGMQHDPMWGLLWGRFCHVGAILIPVFFCYITLKITGRTHKKLLKVGFAIASTFIVLVFVTPYFIPSSRTDVGPAFMVKAGPLYFLIIAFFVLYVSIALGVLWHEIRRSRGARKKHLEYFFVASVLGFVIGVVNFGPPYGIVSPPYPYSAACGAIYFCVIAYAILRHQLFDIELIVKRGVIFGVLFTAVYLTVSLLIFLVGYAFAKLPASLLNGVSIALAMLLYEPLKRLLTSLTNRFLFQKKVRYTTLIQRLTDNLAKTRDIGELADRVSRFLTDQMGLEWAAFYVKHEDDPWFRRSGGASTVPFDRFAGNHAIARLAETRHEPFILSPFDVDSRLDGNTKAKLRQDKIEALLPIFLEGKLYGVLLLGKKKSDDVYTKEDEGLLLTLMDEASMSFLSAKLLKEATRSNLELGQHMKMAAVKKLARGVHHEVRNPLHEIELSCKATLESFGKPRWNALAQEEVAREIDGYLAGILTKVERIKDALGRFARFARPEEDFDLVNLNLHEELEKFITLMHDAHKLDHINVDNRIPHETRIIASEGALQEICFNVFTNAYEAMRGKGTLTLNAEANGEFISFRVRDSGCGIAKDHLHRVFEPYFTTKTNSESVGIGLTIARYHATRMGGSIEAFTVPDGGAEIFIKLKKAYRRGGVRLCEAS